MSDASEIASLGYLITKAFGAVSGLAGGVIAFFNTPEFTGWAGAGKSALVGVSSSAGFTAAGVGGTVAGALVGGLLGTCFNKSVGLVKGAAIAASLGAVYGSVQGYDISKDWLTAADKCAQASQTQTPTVNGDVPGTNMKYDRATNTLSLPNL